MQWGILSGASITEIKNAKSQEKRSGVKKITQVVVKVIRK